MSDDRSKMLYQAWQQASEKFDYFVVGAAGALVAYVGQHVQPTRLALNAGTLELAALALLLGAVVAGLKRIETSVTLLRMNSQLLHTHTDIMCDADILALAEVLAERDEGFIQITQGTGDIRKDLAFLEKLAAVAKRPILHNVVAPARQDPEVHRRPLRWIDKCREQGLPIYAQCGTGRAGFAFTLEHWNLYDASPAWRAVTTGTKEEKIQKMSDPELRVALLDEAEEADRRLQVIQAGVGGNPKGLIVQGVNRQADLQQYVGKSVGDIAEAEGKHPIEVMLDLSLRGDLNVEFLGPDKGSNAEFMAEMMTGSPYTIPGVSDGGAHTKFFTGGAYTTDFLTWLVRDENVVTLEEAHYRLSNLPSRAAGFRDRGTIEEGRAADIVVYDMEELAIDPPWIGDVEYDLPGGEWRRVQRAKGYDKIIVNGQVTFEDGECTGATPGRLLRHGKAD